MMRENLNYEFSIYIFPYVRRTLSLELLKLTIIQLFRFNKFYYQPTTACNFRNAQHYRAPGGSRW